MQTIFKLLYFDLLELYFSKQIAYFSATGSSFSCNVIFLQLGPKEVPDKNNASRLCIISLTKNSLINTKYVLVPNQLC